MLSSRHDTFFTKLGIPFNVFEMAEVAADVPNKRYYIEKLQILMHKQSLYTSVRLSHIENRKKLEL